MKYIEKINNTERIGLHDSKVYKIEFVDHNLVFHFSEGFWLTDEKGKLFKQLKNCRIIYRFIIPEDEELNLTIYNQTKKYKEVKFDKFVNDIKKYGFRIYMEYRCGFAREIIIKEIYLDIIQLKCRILTKLFMNMMNNQN